MKKRVAFIVAMSLLLIVSMVAFAQPPIDTPGGGGRPDYVVKGNTLSGDLVYEEITPHAWTVGKSVAPGEVEIAAGNNDDVYYTIDVTRTAGEPYESLRFIGTVTVENKTDDPIVGAELFIRLRLTGGESPDNIDVATVEVDLPLVGDNTVALDIDLTNHISDKEYKIFVDGETGTAEKDLGELGDAVEVDEDACADLEDVFAWVNELGESTSSPTGITLSTVPTELNWELSSGDLNQDGEAEVAYALTITAASDASPGTYYLKNEALLTTCDTETYVNDSVTLKIVVLEAEEGNGDGDEDECPAAPAIANAYLSSLGYDEGRGDIIRAVAGQMGLEASFQDIEKCDPDYAPAVRAFVDDYLDGLKGEEAPRGRGKPEDR